MDTSISPYILSILFFFIAFLYSSVGLGGGSSYTALLTIFGFNFLAIPTITLTLNLLVTTFGSFNYIRKKHFNFKLFLPFIITSVPMSYFGGSLNINKEVFYWVLFLSLLVVAYRIYFLNSTKVSFKTTPLIQFLISISFGALLGFISGVAGIGGGIYLVPIILIFGLGNPYEAAACGSVFIWINSLSGVIARTQYNAIDISAYLPIIIAVICGGFLGSYIGTTFYTKKALEKVLGFIVVLAIILLGKKIFFL